MFLVGILRIHEVFRLWQGISMQSGSLTNVGVSCFLCSVSFYLPDPPSLIQEALLRSIFLLWWKRGPCTGRRSHNCSVPLRRILVIATQRLTCSHINYRCSGWGTSRWVFRSHLISSANPFVPGQVFREHDWKREQVNNLFKSALWESWGWSSQSCPKVCCCWHCCQYLHRLLFTCAL